MRSRSRSRSRSCEHERAQSPAQTSQQPQSPQTYQDLHAWPERLIDALGAEVLKEHSYHKGITITTDYSGIGTPEIAMGVIYAHLQTRGLAPADQSGLKMHYVCDNDTHCQEVLQARRWSWTIREGVLEVGLVCTCARV